jgi:hypothetical protein
MAGGSLWTGQELVLRVVSGLQSNGKCKRRKVLFPEQSAWPKMDVSPQLATIEP